MKTKEVGGREGDVWGMEGEEEEEGVEMRWWVGGVKGGLTAAKTWPGGET